MKSKMEIRATHDLLCELLFRTQDTMDKDIQNELGCMMAMCCWMLKCDCQNIHQIESRLEFCRDVLAHMNEDEGKTQTVITE